MFSRPRIIPVLLIDNRDLLKTINFQRPVYLGDPVNAVKIFNIKDVDEMIVLDIGAQKRGSDPDFPFLEDIASQAFMPLGYGGGIRTLEQAKKLLAIGFEKVCFNTALINDPELITETAKLAGNQSVVASIDVKRCVDGYFCVVSDGTKTTKVDPVDLAKKAEKLGAGEIFLNSIDRDGAMKGYDIPLIKKVTAAVSIPVTACGGAASISDLKEALSEGGAHAVAAGSMFVFYGRLRAVLITFPSEKELVSAGIYKE